MQLIGRIVGGLTLGASLVWLAAGAASAAPWSGVLHNGAKKPVAAPDEGAWTLSGSASRQIYLNEGKAAVQVVAYVCVDAKGAEHPMVEVVLTGRPPVEAPVGCRSVYLEVDSGEKVMLVNPGPGGASGSYKIAKQG
jgi:hypothetical protein